MRLVCRFVGLPGLLALLRFPCLCLLAGGQGALKAALWCEALCSLPTVPTQKENTLKTPTPTTKQVTFPVLLPVYLSLRSTIPFIIPPGYSRSWLLTSLALWPLAICTYLRAFSRGGWVAVAAAAAGAAAAAAAGWLTRHDAPGAPPLSGWRLLDRSSSGGGAAPPPAAAVFDSSNSSSSSAGAFSRRAAAAVAGALPGTLSVLGFCMGVAWIDTIAGEVVGALSFLAALASFPAGVMGLTLLAWGNSLGDFFGNRAMARAGHASIATTACFAAPLFNMLMSLALGFGGYLAKLGAGSVAVRLTPEVALGCGALVIYNLAIIVVGRACGRLPRWFAVFARCWYGLYFVVACASGFGLFSGARVA